jgi:hypothetical protein
VGNWGLRRLQRSQLEGHLWDATLSQSGPYVCEIRLVEHRPPGSACSIQIGVGLTDAAPGSARATYLAVTNIEAARRELTKRGVRISDIRHKSPMDDWRGGWQPGADPKHRDYASLADFTDPRRQHLDPPGNRLPPTGHRQRRRAPGLTHDLDRTTRFQTMSIRARSNCGLGDPLVPFDRNDLHARRPDRMGSGRTRRDLMTPVWLLGSGYSTCNSAPETHAYAAAARPGATSSAASPASCSSSSSATTNLAWRSSEPLDNTAASAPLRAPAFAKV